MDNPPYLEIVPHDNGVNIKFCQGPENGQKVLAFVPQKPWEVMQTFDLLQQCIMWMEERGSEETKTSIRRYAKMKMDEEKKRNKHNPEPATACFSPWIVSDPFSSSSGSDSPGK